jgi:predicted outer membrane lipoprotein
MAAVEVPSLLARRVRAAASAGWWTLLAGVLLASALGIVYLFVAHTPLGRFTAHVWGVQPHVVTVVWLVFMGLLKLALMLWALACAFLTIWALKLRRMDSN